MLTAIFLDRFTGLITFAAPAGCKIQGGEFFLINPWWKYLNGKKDALNQCVPNFTFPSDIWAVLLAVIEMLLRVGGMIAVVMIIIGGFRYMSAVGNTEKTVSARRTIINALIGLAITVIATAFVSFIGKSLG